MPDAYEYAAWMCEVFMRFRKPRKVSGQNQNRESPYVNARYLTMMLLSVRTTKIRTSCRSTSFIFNETMINFNREIRAAKINSNTTVELARDPLHFQQIKLTD